MKRYLPWVIVVVAVVLVIMLRNGGSGQSDDPRLKAALMKAKEEHKHVMLFFTGSDWCGWCKKLDNEVFSRNAFLDFAQQNLVIMTVDFPRDSWGVELSEKEMNQELAKNFGVRGFPTVFILNSDGQPIAKTGYRDGGAEAYVEHLRKLIASDT